MIGQSSHLSSTATSSRPPSHLSRRHDAFRDDDDDDEEDYLQPLHRNGRSGHEHSNGRSISRADELLTGYSQSRGAEKVRKSPPRQGPRVIAKQADLNWMEERKRRLGLERYREQMGSLTSMRPPGSSGDQTAPGDVKEAAAAERIDDGKQLSGLQIRKSAKSREEEEMEEIRRLQDKANEDNTPPASQAGESPIPQAQSKEEMEDEAARRALLSGQGLGAAFRIDEERIIPISEEEALKRDTDTRPEPPSLSDYAKMPVDEFGAALLRGMGWKEGMGAGKNKQGPTSAPEAKKRAALLGLGAKERKTDNDQHMGVKAKNFKVERPERRYIPVTRVERERESESRPRAGEEDRRRERSRSPPKRRDRDDEYERRDDRRHHRERSYREYPDDHERERERRKRREREQERPYHNAGGSGRR